MTIESDGDHRDHACRGPGAGGPQTASAVLGDVVSAMIPPASTPADARERSRSSQDVESAFYLHLEVADRPGVLAQVAQLLGLQGASVKSVVQKGLGDNARLVMVVHPILESRFFAAVELIAGLDFVRARAARDPRHRRGVRLSRARPDRALPRPPAVRRRRPRRLAARRARRRWSAPPRLSERVGAEVWLKLEGANPTGSFKDRGMTCAVSAAVREGAEAVICASTGNTAASAAAYAARAGLSGAVIVPEGKIATGKLAQALMHGARVIALRGNFDQALELVRELGDRHPIALVNSRQPVPARGPEDRGVRDRSRSSARLDALCIPVGNAGNITAYWKGFQELGRAAADARLPGRGRRAAGHGRARREPRDGRQRDPDRQPGALGGGDGRR